MSPLHGTMPKKCSAIEYSPTYEVDVRHHARSNAHFLYNNNNLD